MQISAILPLAAQYAADQTASIVIWAFAILCFIAFFISFFTETWKDLWENIQGEYDGDGMRRLFMFNRQPYTAVLYIAAALVVSALLAALILFIIGGAGYILLWIVKLLIWALIIVGWICVIGGIICVIGSEYVGCLPIIIGGIIVYFSDTLKSFGDACVEVGFNFYSALNLWDLGQYMVYEYGLTYLCIVATPIAIGVVAAVLTLLTAGAFWLVETVMTSKYNIKHPCPFCHNPSEPAIYLSEGHELPVKLRPGVFGLFHIIHPETGEEMPTMLLNGRDQLARKCPHCGRYINYLTGVEKHIAFVGLPEAGKTCLTYRFIGNMMRRFAEVTFTDQVSNEAKRIIADIKNGKEQELATKTGIGDMKRSLQILLPGKAPLPYHLFINDVGGELFTDSGIKAEHLQFFKDVECINILVDPFTMDFSEYDTDGSFAAWYKKNIMSKGQTRKEKFANTIQSVKALSDQFTHKTDDIHVNLLLVKADTGYVPEDAMDNEALLRDFIIQQMGMAAEVSELEGTYASLHFYAVSALKDLGIDRFTDGIIENLKIKL